MIRVKDICCIGECYRSAFPINGFMIINRLGLNDLIEPINKKLEFQLQDPFLLYRTAKGLVYVLLLLLLQQQHPM